ncbi:MAG: M48 family metallopeptidase [Wolinella sp.]
MVFIWTFLLFYTIPHVIISLLQIQHIRSHALQPPVILPQNEYKQAAEYAEANEQLNIADALLECALFCAWFNGALEWLYNVSDDSKALGGLLFMFGFLLLGALAHMPLNAYKKLVLDKKFGFSQSGARLFLVDTLKEFTLTILIGTPIFLALFYIIENLKLWWLYAFVFVFALIIVANLIYPTLIAPIFNRFTPLEDSELKERIDALLQRAGFFSSGVFVMDASRRDGRLNAYFGGLGKSKRVVLFDTLLKKVSTHELLAVLGHELGHFRHGDIYKGLGFSAILIFLLFFIAGNLPELLFAELGISDTPPAKLAILLLLSAPLGFYFMPLFGMLSRHNEYAADSFGAELEDRESLSSALITLVNENRAFPHSHPLYIFFHYTHPPLLERLKALGCDISKMPKKDKCEESNEVDVGNVVSKDSKAQDKSGNSYGESRTNHEESE